MADSYTTLGYLESEISVAADSAASVEQSEWNASESVAFLGWLSPTPTSPTPTYTAMRHDASESLGCKHSDYIDELTLKVKRCVACLGLISFVSAPLGFALAWFRQHAAVLPLCGALAVCGGYGQMRASRSVEQLFVALKRHNQMDDAVLDPLDKLSDSVTRCSIALPISRLAMIFVVTLPEYYDPLLDGATAGGSQFVLSDQARQFLHHTYSGKGFGAGDLVLFLGLPGCLLLIVVTSTIIQMNCFVLGNLIAHNAWGASYTFFWNCLPAKIVHDDNELENVFSFFEQGSNVSEAASLGLLAEKFSACASKHPWAAGTRAFSKISSKVLVEAVPSSWFSITLLSLTIAFPGKSNETSVFINLLSILTSLYTLVHASVVTIYIYIRDRGIDPSLTNRWLAPAALIAVLGLLAAIANIVRLVGVFWCDSHSFSLQNMSCDHFVLTA